MLHIQVWEYIQTLSSHPIIKADYNAVIQTNDLGAVSKVHRNKNYSDLHVRLARKCVH